MSAIPATLGIYKVTCIGNGRFYIGSAVNLQQRKRQHFSDLRLNKHGNRHVQRAWNKYGEQAFTFEVLEQVLPISLLAREQYWLNKLKPFGRKGFNIAREAGSNLGWKHTPEARAKMKGREFSPEHIAKLSEAKLGKPGRKMSLETREKIGQAHLGREKSLEHRKTMSQTRIGRKAIPATREKMRQAKLGKTHTPEAIENMRRAKRGTKPSLETIETARQARRARTMGAV